MDANNRSFLTGNLRQVTSRFYPVFLTVLLGGLLAASAGAALAPIESTDLPAMDQARAGMAGYPDRGTADNPADAIRGLHASGAAAALSGPLPFSSVAYPTGLSPWSVTVADLNGDGHPELIVPSFGDNTTQILYGDATGTYSVSRRVALDDGSTSGWRAVTGDFNEDGRADLAIVHYYDGVHIWLQNPDGSFGSGGSWNAAIAPPGNFHRCLVSADLNGDAHADLAIIAETGVLSIYFGTGTGTAWALANTYYSFGLTDWIETADLNEDGQPDLVLSNDSPYDNVSVFLNQGGYFGWWYVFPTGAGPNTCTVADLNGDGHVDVATANWNVAGSYSVLLGRGNGTLRPAITTSIPDVQRAEPFAVAAAEMTGDGVCDLVVGMGVAGTVSVLAGNGDGTFHTDGVYGVGYAARGIALADVNGDGRTDMATSNLTSASVSVLTADAQHRFPGAVSPIGTDSAATFPTDDRLYGNLASGDFNGDGHVDLATAHWTAGTVSVVLGNGDGTFGAPTDYTVGQNPEAVLAADLNGDGDLDLATANRGNGTVSVLFGKGDGTFKMGKSQFGVGKAPTHILAADMNGDGRLDLITTNSEDNTVSVLLKNPGGNGFKDRRNSDTGPSPRGAAAADLTGDGVLDLVVANYYGRSFSVLVGRGDGTFYIGASQITTNFYPTSLTLADLNRDGRLDVAVTTQSAGTVEVHLGTGPLSFVYSSYTLLRDEPREVVAHDLDGDGWLELIVPARLGNTFVVYPYGPAPDGYRRWAFGSCGTSVAVVDANEDGVSDVITLNPRAQGISPLLNELSGGALASPGPAASSAPDLAEGVSISPNPLNPQATLRFSLSEAGPLRVKLYDVQGKLVRTLLDEEYAAAGVRTVRVDGKSDRGDRLASGVYFYRIEFGGKTVSGRLAVVK